MTVKCTKWMALLLAGLMTVSCFFSCDSGDGGTESSTDTETVSETEAETDPATESATESATETEGDTETTPSIQYNRTLKIVTLTDKKADIVPSEEQRGEILSEAILARNAAFDQEFGVTIQVIDGGDYETLKRAIAKEQSMREDAYDIYINQLSSFTGNALQNHLVDLNQMPGVDLKNPWWDQACRENLTIDGHNFMMSGDISPDSLLYSACMVFNKRMMAELGKEDPYGLVENGDWTLDALYTYIDGVTNETLGRYGLTAWSFDVPYSLFYGCGETFVKFNEDGCPELSYDTTKVKGIYESMYKIIYGAKSNYAQFEFGQPVQSWPSVDWNAYEPFFNGNALFADVTLHKIARLLSTMEDDYGILPMPKYEAGQKNYLSFVNGAAGHVMVSSTECDREFVGAMLEALGMFNYIAVTPFFSVVVAQDVQNPDPVNAEMVNGIIRNRVYDFAYWSKEQLVISDVVSNGLAQRNDKLDSTLKSAHNQSSGALAHLLNDWDKIVSRT